MKRPFRLVYREILRKDKKEIGKALLAAMRAFAPRASKPRTLDLKARLGGRALRGGTIPRPFAGENDRTPTSARRRYPHPVQHRRQASLPPQPLRDHERDLQALAPNSTAGRSASGTSCPGPVRLRRSRHSSKPPHIRHVFPVISR